jgi:hypothetical protein
MAQDIPASLIRQVDVKENQVKWLLRRCARFIRRNYTIGLGNGIATSHKIQGNDTPERKFIFDNEYASHSLPAFLQGTSCKSV